MQRFSSLRSLLDRRTFILWYCIRSCILCIKNNSLISRIPTIILLNLNFSQAKALLIILNNHFSCLLVKLEHTIPSSKALPSCISSCHQSHYKLEATFYPSKNEMCTQQKTRKGDDRMATMLTVSLYPGMSLQNAAGSTISGDFRDYFYEVLFNCKGKILTSKSLNVKDYYLIKSVSHISSINNNHRVSNTTCNTKAKAKTKNLSRPKIFEERLYIYAYKNNDLPYDMHVLQDVDFLGYSRRPEQ